MHERVDWLKNDFRHYSYVKRWAFKSKHTIRKRIYENINLKLFDLNSFYHILYIIFDYG